jgi:DNA-binding transcriptional ArsR family regulator
MSTPQRPHRKPATKRARRAEVRSANAAAETAAKKPPADTAAKKPPADTAAKKPPADTAAKKPPADTAPNGPAADSRPARQVVTDARAMRALAHPLRLALLEAMRRDGEITATRAAELLDESPGNMSWHLQTLAKYGFVEETGEGRGRSRPWRLASESRTFETGTTDPEAAAAGEALERTFIERIHDQLRDWWSRRLTYPLKWRRAAFMTESVTYLTAPELASISEEIHGIYTRYKERAVKERRPPGALPVHLYAHGHPLPPTPSGN